MHKEKDSFLFSRSFAIRQDNNLEIVVSLSGCIYARHKGLNQSFQWSGNERETQKTKQRDKQMTPDTRKKTRTPLGWRGARLMNNSRTLSSWRDYAPQRPNGLGQSNLFQNVFLFYFFVCCCYTMKMWLPSLSFSTTSDTHASRVQGFR